MSDDSALAVAGPYLGEISALAFLHLPSHLSSPFPLILAGTGSQVLVYKLQPRKLLLSFPAFSGVRVHGLSLQTASSSDQELIAVYGERRVKLLRVMVGEDGDEVSIKMEVSSSLPRFDHWVLDALFLEEERYLAVGLSDNSIAVWDISLSRMLFRVKSSEKCLLYSMRLWGKNVKELCIASGTILNEIVVWKFVAFCNHLEEDSSSDCNGVHIIHMGRLLGHNGSIFRIAWSSDGSKLVSVSDDRSARMWVINTEKEHGEDQVSDGVSFYGHNARIWDCHISDSIIITAGEDCSCRLWGMDGSQIMMFKEHNGRGIWRCIYDPSTSLLVTAGFDSAIQVLQLPIMSNDDALADSNDDAENFSICIPDVSEKLELMDSKSEYVRCLQFAREDILYVATNKGYLYHSKFSSPNDIKWTQLVHVGEVPIVCMDFMGLYPSDTSQISGDLIALGDGKGKVTVIRVLGGASRPEVVISVSWSAEKERQLLGIHWCLSLGCSYVFTVDPRGSLNLWRLDYGEKANVCLVAAYASSFGKRITCLDASMKDELLVCGDQHGNLVIFPLPENILPSDFEASQRRIPSIALFKGAHGISSVTSIFIRRQNGHQIEIRSTGGDGCICCLNFLRSRGSIEFCGMKHIKELTIIKSIVDNISGVEDLREEHFVIGFAFTDFFIWNLMTNSKILRIPCGGWRRPYSYYLGHTPEAQNCFAFLKDNKIHIYRQWKMGSKRKSFPKMLHMQSHGREVHATCFASLPMGSKSNQCNDLWVASGSEDGTVRLTSYAPSDMESWSASHLLGEHVGGSAVRSLCFVSKIFPHSLGFMRDDADMDNTSSIDHEKDWCILISVGAKQVLTSWLLRNDRTAKMSASEEHSSISFQWISTHIPRKHRGGIVRTDKDMDTLTSKSKSKSKTHFCSSLTKQTRSIAMGDDANDWRYLAVTAFVVEEAETRLRVCFVVVACSDATLTLRALLLPHRLWFDVALLVPQTSPVLALKHMAVPLPSNGENSERNAQIIISGSTDGSITLWDLTKTVDHFMQFIGELQPEEVSKSQWRPQTGRGSQGGRWWRSVDLTISNSKPIGDESEERLPKEERNFGGFQAEMEILPVYVLGSVHQSGVNCLHVASLTKNEQLTFCVLSGGDDQAVSCVLFGLIEEKFDVDCGGGLAMGSLVNGCKLRMLNSYKVESAHSAAVKGIWSDGLWVFSTGLDQRIRCWRIDGSDLLTEHAHLIISVPEPESLDAMPHGRSGDSYRIVVAGRGMQMIEFSPQGRDHAVIG